MIELVLFIGGMMTAWAVAALLCAERQRRVRNIQRVIEEERAAAAVAAEEARRNPRRTQPVAEPLVAKAA